MLNKKTKEELDSKFSNLLRRNPDNSHLFDIMRTVPCLAEKAFKHLDNPDETGNIIKSMFEIHRSENHKLLCILWSKLEEELNVDICQRLLRFYREDHSDLNNEEYTKKLKEIRIQCENWLAEKPCYEIVNEIINYHHSESRK